MKHICPICSEELKKHFTSMLSDYRCTSYLRCEHFYVHRYKGNQLTVVKFRLDDLYMKIHYEDGYLQVWTDNSDKVTINTLPDIDFSDLEK